VKPVDEEMREADIGLKKAREAYLLRPPAPPRAGGGKSSGGKREDGKTLPATTVEGIADLPVAEAAIDQMVNEFKRLGMGGTSGKVGAFVNKMGLNALAPDSAEYEAIAKIGMQSVGKILEGGKLAAGDEVKYSAMLPRGGDEPATVEAKRSHLKAFMRALVDARAKGLKESGYSVPASFFAGAAPAATPADPPTPDIPPKVPAGQMVVIDLESGDPVTVSKAAGEAAVKAGKAKLP
jgi:hypothetical protein